jgi:CDP-diacylglycerol--serine O-phosphatidyltransferase
VRINLRKSLFILPNLFTCSSIFCAFYATLRCIGEADSAAFFEAALWIVFAMFFDTIDGRVARLTRTQSAFGVQLDSLADVVSFGIAPAILVYRWSLHELGTLGLLACFVYLACGAIRLARFNVMAMDNSGGPKKPSKYFLGLPIPAAAGILVSLVIANHTVAGELASSPFVILLVVGALSFFMVSAVRFRSFKEMRVSWRSAGLFAFAVVSSAAISVQYHPSFALVWLLTCYVVIALAETVFGVSRRRRPAMAIDTTATDLEDDVLADDDDATEHRSA